MIVRPRHTALTININHSTMDDFDFSAPAYFDFQGNTEYVVGVEDEAYFGTFPLPMFVQPVVVECVGEMIVK